MYWKYGRLRWCTKHSWKCSTLRWNTSISVKKNSPSPRFPSSFLGVWSQGQKLFLPSSLLTSFVFLGVILDKHLSWKQQIAYVANKVSKSAGIIFKSNFYLFKTSLRTLYFSLVYPHLYYCNVVWASTYSSNLRRIVLFQKRVSRTLNKSKLDAHTDSIFKELSIMKFQDICS